MTNGKQDINLREKILTGALKSLEAFSINKLNNIIAMSEEERREYGFIFCSSTDVPPFGDISHSELCMGDRCSVEINDCKSKKQIGTFHTHTHSKTHQAIGSPSDNDIYTSISNKQSFSCIGITENKNQL